jgi:hypothetical protein
MSGFTLSYTANMFILIILYDFCLLSAHLCCIIVYGRLKAVCKSWTGVRLGKFPWCAEPCFAGTEILRGRCLPLIPRRESVSHITDLISVLWRVSLMLALKRSHSNSE